MDTIDSQNPIVDDVADMFADIPLETAPAVPDVPAMDPVPDEVTQVDKLEPKGQPEAPSQPEVEGGESATPEKPALDPRQVELEERKLRETAEKLFSFVEKYPQTHLSVGASREEGGKRLLRANASGSITLAATGEGNGVITIEFADTHRMKKRVLENTHKFCRGDISDSAFVLASQGQLEDVDEYEEDHEDQESEAAVLYFCNATKDTTWSVELPVGETIAEVALSSKYVFVLTGSNTLRGFDYGKNEVFQVSFEAPVVSICAFEHFLGVVYQTGLPAQGMQAMRVRVYNTDEMKVDFDVSVALSPYKKLQWFGFANDGVLYSQDTADCVRVLTAQHLWVPVFHNPKTKKFWLLGVLDKDLVGYYLVEGESNPNPNYRYQPESLKRKVSLLTDRQTEKQEGILLRRIDLTNEARTSQEFAFMKQTETSNPLRSIFKGRIKDAVDLADETTELETEKVDLVRRLLVEGNTDAAIHFALQIRSLAHFQVVLSLLDSMKEKKVREELTRTANEFGFFDRLSLQTALTPRPAQPEPIPVNPQTEEKRANLRRFLDENKPSDNNKLSFEGFRTQTLQDKETTPPPATQAPTTGPNTTHVLPTIERPVAGRSIMEEFGAKQKKGTGRGLN